MNSDEEIMRMVNDKKIHGNSRKIIQIHPLTLQIIKIWNSAMEAANILNYIRQGISNACQNKFHYCGYYWRYYDEYFKEMYSGDYFIKGYSDPNDNSIIKSNFKCDIFDFLVYNNLSNYIQPCFIYQFGEIWKDVIGYEGLYKISSYGRVISLWNYPYIYEMRFDINNNGYYRIMLYDKNGNRKKFSIHRLVAEAFIPNPNNLPCINHKDEIKINNYVSNLEWCDYEYNNNYNNKMKKIAKIQGKTVEQIDLTTGEVINEFWGINEASRITGITNISAVCLGKLKSAGGFYWRFKKKV